MEEFGKGHDSNKWFGLVLGSLTYERSRKGSSISCYQSVDKVGFAPEAVSDADAEIALWACHIVAKRAAKLSACAVAAVLIQTGNATLGGSSSSADSSKLAVGVDGR